MDKQILEQYIDACVLVKETRAELEKLRRAKKRQEQDAVKGSAHEFPYTLQTWINTIPVRMQRIIRYRVFEELQWAEVATKMGRKATPDGIRKEYENFMKVA